MLTIHVNHPFFTTFSPDSEQSVSKTNRRSTNSKTTGAVSQLRIIGGKWRSRKVSFESWEGLRPTPDRVRETLFNWLNFDIENRVCLDLFAGTGILGLEALSRGATASTFVDSAASSCRQLKKNLLALTPKGDPEGSLNTAGGIIQADVMQHLQKNSRGLRFDVVFADPPFRKNFAAPMLNLLESNNWLNPNALIYVETESELNRLDAPANWAEIKQKCAGQVTYRLFRRTGV